ncbi:MAG TPA: tetratricopeptide repeat protein [bacterium]|nr:tetratricopeptide repeat protein [bacterium]
MAQTVLPAASRVTPLSALGASARADALGGAMTGLADDPSAIFFDPAGLSQLRSAELSINHNSYLADSFEETILFGLPTPPLGGFGGALQYVSWGGLDKRDANGVSQGSFADSDVAFTLGWGLPVTPDLAVGIALSGVQQKIIDSLYTGLTGDLGVLWRPAPGFRLGLTYSGLGTVLAGHVPAQDLRLGTSLLLPIAQGFDLRPLLAGDWQPEGVSRISGGLEGRIERDFFLRVGYQGVLSDNQIGGLTGLTAGAGFRIERFRLDYAFVPEGDLGTSHRVSVGYEFPNPTPVPAKPVTVTAPPVTVQGPPVTILATPPPTPAPVSGPPKSKVEVHFELPGAGAPVTADAQASSLVGAYEKAAQASPADSRAWRNLGIAYLKAGKTAMGLQCLDQALRLDPSDQALKKWLDDYRAKHPANP